MSINQKALNPVLGAKEGDGKGMTLMKGTDFFGGTQEQGGGGIEEKG